MHTLTEKLGNNLHTQARHPVCVVKELVHERFGSFQKFDDLGAVVTEKTAETYEVDGGCLRTSMSAHLCPLLSDGYTSFLAAGEVYRKDVIDRYHGNVFHQLMGVRLCRTPALFLTLTVDNLLRELLPRCAYRRTGQESWRYEVEWRHRWLPVVSADVLSNDVIERCGLDGEYGWKFIIGLDRLAMVLFDIPSLRLLWSEDFDNVRFVKDVICCRELSYCLPPSFSYNDFCEVVRKVGGDFVDSVQLVKSRSDLGRLVNRYKINYRSITKDEADFLHGKIRKTLATELYLESVS